MRRVFYIVAIFLIVGCSRVIDKYRVNIDAVTDSKREIPPSSYIIKPLSKKDDLKFQRESSKLAEILNQKGYFRVKDKKSAKQIIYFDYGVEKIKEETQIYSEPDISFGVGWGYPYYSSFWNDIGYTRYRTYSKTYKVFNRYIVILSKDKNQKELWRVDVSSIGESNNLSKIIPILLKASIPYIGKNLDNPIEIDVKDENRTK